MSESFPAITFSSRVNYLNLHVFTSLNKLLAQIIGKNAKIIDKF